jgi:hypothetical protein
MARLEAVSRTVPTRRREHEVLAEAPGRPAAGHIVADAAEVGADGEEVALHPLRFGVGDANRSHPITGSLRG